ncbi:acriflavin resistance protein [Halioglobus japonicus]|uniref:AcrB/AcrD/AcrF family protein n=1 Tax=Halioglobus japonicus TaxID=930805 RepID=A0AAP8SPJ3_9GAMM|nr:efflux RND transporter permease subunit [Halioglobus japonicus]AQA19229.1 acriflavin resistance protein [Halioglobus japonicus]PLW87735.1 AcrB/AcrD/AcrF family protein [Halioglobus japonicus]GHD06873.1 acriflavine resistance protein B [Halioglobus japonicus]
MFEKIIARGTLVTVSVLIVAVIGILAATRIPVQMIPDLDVRTIGVRTVWPGATPQDVEKELIIEQEDFLRNLPNLSRITSTAQTSSASIQLEFPLGVDMTDMMIRVSNALSQVPNYPENVDEPAVFASSFSSNAFMFFNVVPLPGNPRQLDMDLVRDFLIDNLRPRMASVPGVSEVDFWGGSMRQVQILVDPARLAQRGLTLMDVRNAIRTRNQDRSGGDLSSGKRQYMLRTIGRFEDLSELENLILDRREDNVIHLKDVATVQLDHFEKRQFARYNGQENITIAIRRESGSNVIEIKQQMLAEVDALREQVLKPAGMDIVLSSDDVRYVEDSVATVWKNLILGALLATAVMYLFLRSGRATAVGVIGIPLCIIVAFLGLLLAGRTINVISLAGIAFALGMTLDNSIVVLESIELERRGGASRFQAAVNGVRKVWPAVFASTMTTVLVFLPVLFVEQEAGQLYSDIAIAISAAILASLLVAITVLPTAAARLEFVNESKQAKSAAAQEAGAKAWTLRQVARLLHSPRSRLTTVLVAVIASALVIVVLTPPAEYLPEGEEPKIFSSMSPPPGYNLDTLERIASEVEAYFLTFVGVDPEAYDRGEIDVPALKYFSMRVNAGRVGALVEPVRHQDIEPLMDALTGKYREYPGMRAFASRGSIISSNDGGSRSINLDISGPDLFTLFQVARTIEQRAEEVLENPRIQSQPRSLSLAQPMMEIHPRWERAAELGIDANSLGYTVSAMTDGAFVDEFFLDDDKIDMYLYSDTGLDVELENMRQLPLYTARGEVVPLGAIADFRESVDTNAIRRVGGRRTVTLNIIPPRTTPLESGVEQVKSEVMQYLLDSGAIPANVTVSISGAADALQKTRDALLGNYLVALFIVYLLMVAIFNHWGYPLLILTSIPVGIAGGLVGLWTLNGVGALLPLFGGAAIVQPFDMITMLGFLILMGTVVNNPILVVHRAVENARTGLLPLEAVTEAVQTRLRPIAMSTITTLCGLAPLVLLPGAGTELYRGLGAIVLFGILGSMLVTLTMLPALTVMVLEFQRRKS